MPIATFDSSHLLESVIRLTEQRDQHSLEICLVQTLQELIQANTIMLYEYVDDNGQRKLKQIITIESANANQKACAKLADMQINENDPDVAACLASKSPVISHAKCGGICQIYPVIGKDEVAGFLFVETDELNERNQELTSSFLRIYHNYLLLLSDNERDTLTGLLNRKTFDSRILKIMTARQSTHRRLFDKGEYYSLAIFDIDHFKSINDHYGHLYGDEVLLLFAQIMGDTFRDSDLLFRYGGEEFVAILKLAKPDEDIKVLDRFRRNVESFAFPQVGKVTISIGFVRIDEQDLPTTIIGQADQAMYYAKENGRNQVCSYEQLLAEGKLTAQAFRSDMELF